AKSHIYMGPFLVRPNEGCSSEIYGDRIQMKGNYRACHLWAIQHHPWTTLKKHLAFDIEDNPWSMKTPLGIESWTVHSFTK
ncbi:hypothetical protein RUM43_002155, partial [Polyplax serrata]